MTFGSTNFVRHNHASDYYSSLAFEFDFEYENDEVYFAMSQPYTYSRLVHFIKHAQEGLSRYPPALSRYPPALSRYPLSPLSPLMQLRTVGYSIANNIIPALRVSLAPDPKQTILVIARQHPCETAGSFIAEKLMAALLERDPVS